MIYATKSVEYRFFSNAMSHWPGATTQAYELLKFITFYHLFIKRSPHTWSDVIKQKFLTLVVQSKWKNLFFRQIQLTSLHSIFCQFIGKEKV